MRILGTSDWHRDAVTAGVARRAEHREYVGELKKVCKRERIDIVLNTGDDHDPGSMLESLYATEMAADYAALAEATAEGVMVGIAGNHDVVETAELCTVLSPIARVYHELACASGHADPPETPHSVVLLEEPTFTTIGTREIGLFALPYVSRTRMEATREDPDLLEKALEEALLWKTQRPEAPLIVASHLTVPGARMGSESKEMARGRDQLIPIDLLHRLKPTLIINGHYHRPQVVKLDGLEIVIPGSWGAFTFDDDSRGKGYVILEV